MDIKKLKIKGFTLAEVLITLVVIGVVSALVIPSVLKNYNDKKYNTARLKALKTFGEAGKMASINGEINGQPTARAFVENVLSKYLKIVKVCDNDKASECNFTEKITFLNKNDTYNRYSNWTNLNDYKTWIRLNGHTTTNNITDINNPDLSIYITTADGFSAKLFYNPNCIRNSHDGYSCVTKECNTYAVDAACMNVIYDMNGTKNPNHIGEDIGFVTVFWSGINTVAASPGLLTYEETRSTYAYSGYQSAVLSCAQSGTKNKPRSLPDVYELSSIALNKPFMSMPDAWYWSGSNAAGNPQYYWNVAVSWGQRSQCYINSCGAMVWCVRR